jgi:lysophospholipase L1-like esterase
VVLDTPAVLAPAGVGAFDDDRLHLSPTGYALLRPALAAAVDSTR